MVKQPYNFSVTVRHKGKELVLVTAHFVLQQDDSSYSPKDHSNELCHLASEKLNYWLLEHLEENSGALAIAPVHYGRVKDCLRKIDSPNFQVTRVIVSEVTPLMDYGPSQHQHTPIDQLKRKQEALEELDLYFKTLSEDRNISADTKARLKVATVQLKGKICSVIDRWNDR